MVRNQDDASFVSWTATLHPESATSAIDPRFQDSQSHWVTVFNEAANNFPVDVQVVSVDEDQETDDMREEEEQQQQQQQHHHHHHRHHHSHHDEESSCMNGNVRRRTNNAGCDGNHVPSRSCTRPQPWKHSNFVDLVLGFSMTFSAVATTLKLELCAIIIYMLASGCHYISEKGFRSPYLMMFKAIMLLLSSIFMFVDAILLVTSVLVTEALGCVAHLLCAIFGGPRSGSEWHQYVLVNKG